MANYSGSTSYGTTLLRASGTASVQYSADESLIYVASRDGKIDVFSTTTGTLLTTWNVATALAGMSLSTDGSFLLAVDPGKAGTVYRIATANGAVQTLTGGSNAFNDVEIVDSHSALLLGWGATMKLNLDDGTISALNGYSYYGALAIEDEHLTLLVTPGISNGPLSIYDDRTGTIVASGDNYQGGKIVSGFNWGHQAISEAAGLVAQFSYPGSVNIYDLSLRGVTNISLGERVDGLTFDKGGNYFYAYLIDTGVVAKYDVATWSRVDQYAVGMSDWHNNTGSGDQLHLSSDGNYITVSDTNSGALQVIDLTARHEVFAGTEGADNFAGRDGNDVYYINDAGDMIVETPVNGDDLALLSVSFALADNVERGTVAVATGLSVTGNALANFLTGNVGDDTLAGGAGHDWLAGGAGDDRLAGGAGNDILDGGEGSDAIDYADAGAGVTIDLAVVGVQETGGGGLDTIQGIENVFGSAFDDLLDGDGGANWLVGNGGGDVQSGGDGHDSVWGGDGDDLLNGGEGDDTIFGGTGIDTVSYAGASAGVEIDLSWFEEQQTRGAGVDTLIAVENVIGSAFGDVLKGSADANLLTGGGGDDRFVFDDAAFAARDTIADFALGDLIDLGAIDANGAAAGDAAFAFIGAAGFGGIAGQLRASGSGTSWLVEGDLNGDGVADFGIAVVTQAPGLGLAASDFLL